MPGKRYSAGAIFLQVVPVFANVQHAIADEAKNIDRVLGDQMEKSGEKAGERAGKAASKKLNEEMEKGTRKLSGDFERQFHQNIDSINKALGGIDTKRLSNNLRSELADVKKELAGLKGVDIAIDGDTRKVDHKLAELEGRVLALRDGVKIIFRSDIDSAVKGFAKVAALKEAISDPVEIKVKTDFAPVERVMSDFEKSFKKTCDKAASHLSGAVGREASKVHEKLRNLQELRIGVDISGNRARAELAKLMAEAKRLSHESVDIEARVHWGATFAELAAFEMILKRIDHTTVEPKVKVDKAQRGLFGLARTGDDASNSFRSFNLIMLAVAGLGPALVPVLGAIAGGLVAIGPAAAVAGAGLGSVLIGFSGIKDVLTALQAKQDHVTTSTQTNAKAEASSARAVANARRSAARAVTSALDAQKAAQDRYKKSIQDVQDAEQALRDARAAAKGTGADLNRQIEGNKLAIDQALLDSFHATVTYDAVTSDGSSTNAEKEQARIDREQALLHLKELRAQQRELAAEKKKWDKEGVNGTTAVKSAQDQLNSALEAQKAAYKDLGDAAKNVDQARADGARQVKDALDSQAMAMAKVNAQQQAVDAAMGKLGPAGRKFALFIFALKKGFYALRDDIQTVLLPSVQKAISGFLGSKSGGVLRQALINLADGFGKFTLALSKSFQGSAWTGFFQMLAKLGPKIQAAYGRAFVKFLEAMASLLTAAAPFALRFANGLARMMDAFARWASSKKGTDSFTKFLDWVGRVGPDVLSFLGNFIDAAVNIGRALAPWGGTVLKALDGFLKFVSGMDPKTLGLITTTIIGLILASQLAYSQMNILKAARALFTSSIGIWVFAIVGLALALVYLYNHNEKFRKFVKKAWPQIAKVVKKAWKEDIKPALTELWDALKYLWKKVLAPFIVWAAPKLLWLAKKIFPLVARYFSDVIKTIAWVIRHVAVPIFEFFGSKWKEVSDSIKWVNDHVIKPSFEWISKKALPALKESFHNTVRDIGKAWEGLKGRIAKPIKWVIEEAINHGVIHGFNKLAGFVHAPKLHYVPTPKWVQNSAAYATGGVLPGYTPGRDVHQFVSPTGGRLRLSGGEAVMRPEWTAGVGSGFVNAMNAIARSGGVKAVRRAMGMDQAYAQGGVIGSGGDDAVYINGKKISKIAAAQIALARKISGIPIYMMQGGYGGSHIAASGSSHNYPGVGDFGPGSITLEKVLRRVGFAAWARNVAGRSQVGSGAHVHAASLLDPGDRNDPQIYGSWANHGNGLGGINNDPAPHYSWISGLLSKIAHMGVGQITAIMGAGSRGEHHPHLPGWMMSLAKNPLHAVKSWITGPLKSAKHFLGDAAGSPFFKIASRMPLYAAKRMTDKVWDVIPGWVKSAAGWAGDAAHWAVGGVKGAAHDIAEGAQHVGHGIASGAGAVGDFLGLHTGGILPYNGTMKYDNGGYLPPGLTSVVNLTGKPEPVFTADQWGGMGGKGGASGTIHYEPHFEGSDLTAEDVAGDLNFTFTRMRRGGKYAEVGQ